MPRDSGGTYSRNESAYVNGAIIDETKVNSEFDDVASELTNSIDKGGRTTPTANLPMGGYRLTGLGAGSTAGHSARYEQTVDGIMTTRGDVVRRGASSPERLALGSSGQALESDGTDVVWAPGLGSVLTTRGDVVVRGASTAERLAVGAAGAVLESDGTDVAWTTTVPKKDEDNIFSGDLTVEKTSANPLIRANRTDGADGRLFVVSNSVQMGSWSAHLVGVYVNGTRTFQFTTNSGLIAEGLQNPATAGGVNVKSLEVNGAEIPYQAGYTSGELAITPADGGTLAHGLGATPRNVTAHLVCKIAEKNYTVGQKVVIAVGIESSGGTANGISVIVDGTNLTYRIGASSVAPIVDASTGGSPSTPTTANWRLVLKADA